MKIFLTHPIPGAALEKLKKVHNVDIWPGPYPIPRPDFLGSIAGADAVICMLTEKIDERVLAAAGPQLKIVANYAVGFDNIDLAAAAARKVIITNTQGNFGDAVAEMTMTLILALARRLVEADRWMRTGNFTGWNPELFLGIDLSGKTIGIVGMGTIGFEVARRADALFGMKVIYTSHREKPDAAAHNYQFTALDQLLPAADVVSLHLPLTTETRHLIDADKLMLMKPTAMLVNTARGPVVDETALYETLVNRRIWGAALDVFEHEMSLSVDPVWHKLAQLPNLIMTPHLGSATLAAREQMTKIAVDNVLAVLSGQPPLTPIPLPGS